MRRIITLVLAILITAFTINAIHGIHNTGNKVELKEIEIKDTGVQLKLLQEQYDKELQNNDVHEETIKALQDEKTRLEQELSAKQEAKRIAAERANKAIPVVLKPKKVYAAAPSGSCADWIAAAGITEVASANELIRRESGCNPNAVNRSSGACGVAQELPCGKSGCSLGDGACQVKWMNKYTINRYKSWAEAVRFHNVNNWY